MLQVLVHPDGSWLQSALARVEKGASRSIAGALLCIGFREMSRGV